MDSNRPNSGNTSGRENEGGGVGDSSKPNEGLTPKDKIMASMLFVQVIISAIVGAGLSNHLGMIWTIVICVFLGSLGMFFGMAMGVVRYRTDGDAFKEALGFIQLATEMRWRRRLQDAVADTKKECLGFALESARTVADKVANRIIARHAKNLLEPEYLEATLVDTNEIVNEELEAFEEALKIGD